MGLEEMSAPSQRVTETVLACDFGGTWLRVAEVDRDGKVLWDARAATAHDYDHDMELVLDLAQRRSPNIVAAGIACPGPLDWHTGEVLKAANLNWFKQFPGKFLQEGLGVVTVVENDADCAALAEWRYGAGRESGLQVFYGIGTGVGAGVVTDGHIFHGSFDPEFGHQILEPACDRVCTAGHRGCLEALISGRALETAYGSIDDVPDVEWQDTVPRYLGQALANAVLFLSPDAIVVGGGVMDHRPDLLPPAVRVMDAMLHDFVTLPRVVPSELGPEMGILGAAAAAWNLLDGAATPDA